MPRLTKVLTGLAVTACLAVAPASAMALPGAHVSSTKLVKHVNYPETQHLHYEYGPIDIAPGQNNIEAKNNNATSPPCRATSRASSPTSSIPAATRSRAWT